MLNAISGGRAEVILGRGSSIESFPLFGYDLADYEQLFEEKATLFAELLNRTSSTGGRPCCQPQPVNRQVLLQTPALLDGIAALG